MRATLCVLRGAGAGCNGGGKGAWADNVGGDRGWRPVTPLSTRAVTLARVEVAEQTAHRLMLEIERLQADGVSTHLGLARALSGQGVSTPHAFAQYAKDLRINNIARGHLLLGVLG